ncbi:hypothetical protein EV702DRAFT_1044489 [Suillus placidus]|uniref:Uncharacterized protein n=1 Tax=Suillus placidus TaxID=48579 RepID=A0A9P6ZXL4_9AGAM|nr:hypothetical protein EV702DRAFT_1044489 [Suillus placidus]
MSTLRLSKSIWVVETCVEMWELNVLRAPFALNPSITTIICTATFVLMVCSGRDKSKGASEKTRKNQYSYDTKLEECLCSVCILECPEGKMIPKWQWRQHKGTDKEQKMRLKAEKKAQKAEQAETSSAPDLINEVSHDGPPNNFSIIHNSRTPSPAYLQFPMDVGEALIMDAVDVDEETSDMDGHGCDMDEEEWNTDDRQSLHFDSKPHYGDTDDQDINSDAGASPGLNLFYCSRTISPIPPVPPLIQHSQPASPTCSDSESPAPAEASEIPASDVPDPRRPVIIHEPPPKPKDVFDTISSHGFWRMFNVKKGKPKACLQCPQNPLSSVLLRLIHQEGIEPELDAWRSQTASLPGKQTCIQDGDIWKTLPVLTDQIRMSFELNQEQNKKDLQNWDKREKTCLNRIAKGKGMKKDAEPSAKPVERMLPDDAKFFFTSLQLSN